MQTKHRSPASSQSFRLERFSTVQQQYGTFVGGYHWQVFGCGTFRGEISERAAVACFRAFLYRLRKSLGQRSVSVVAVLERRRWSGVGMPGSPLHWHFLLAAPDSVRDALERHAGMLWARYGESKIEAYDPTRAGTYYLFKRIHDDDFCWFIEGLKRMAYTGPEDLFMDQQTNSHVPEHARNHPHLVTLTLRPEEGNYDQPASEVVDGNAAQKQGCRRFACRSRRVGGGRGRDR